MVYIAAHLKIMHHEVKVEKYATLKVAKKYHCAKCMEGYDTKSSLEEHVQQKHDMKTLPSSSIIVQDL